MAYYPFAQATGARYVLSNPSNGVIAVFNDQTDPNYVGVLSSVTGLDSPDLRETADDLVQQDGGQHGDFWLGRRPISLTGSVFNHTSELERNLRMDRINRASLALRGDATLAWKPAERQENLILNPNLEHATITNYAAAGATIARVTGVAGTTGTQALRATSTGAASFGPYVGGAAPNRMPVTQNTTYTFSFNLLEITAGRTVRASIEWKNINGSNISTSAGTLTSTLGRVSVTGTAPAGAVSVSVTAYTNAGAVGNIVTTDSWAFGPGTSTAYFDGDAAGYYWQGTPQLSTSGDFVEMYVPVRRQQPLRFAGAWVKEFQLQLVSEWATMFSAQQQVSTTGSAENRGSYPAFPVFRITGAAVNPHITVTSPTGATAVLKTTINIPGGQYVDIDTFSHTATHSSGISYNRYIDFAGTTIWPTLMTGVSTIARTSGTGTLTSTTWRDTWV